MTHLFLALSLEKLPRYSVFTRKDFRLALPHKIDVYTAASGWLAQMLELYQLQAEDLCALVLNFLEPIDLRDALNKKAIAKFSILIKGICLDHKTPMLSFAILDPHDLSESSIHKHCIFDLINYSITYGSDLRTYQYTSSEHYGQHTSYFNAYSNIILRFFTKNSAHTGNPLTNYIVDAVYMSTHLQEYQKEIIKQVFFGEYRIETDYSFYEVEAFNFAEKIKKITKESPNQLIEVKQAIDILFENFSRNSHLLTAILIPFKRAIISYGFFSTDLLLEIDQFFEDYRNRFLSYFDAQQFKDKIVSIQAATDLDDLELCGVDFFHHISKNKEAKEISGYLTDIKRRSGTPTEPSFELHKITPYQDHVQVTIKMVTTFNIHYQIQVLKNFQEKARLECTNEFMSSSEKINLKQWFNEFKITDKKEMSDYFSKIHVPKELYIILTTSKIISLYSNCETNLHQCAMALSSLIAEHIEFKDIIIKNILWNQSTHFPYQLKREILARIKETHHPEADLFFDFKRHSATLINKKNMYSIFDTLSQLSVFLRSSTSNQNKLISFFETLAFLVFSEQWIGPGHDENAGIIANIAKDVFLILKPTFLNNNPRKKEYLNHIEEHIFKAHGLKSILGEINRKSLSISKEDTFEKPANWQPKHPRATAAKLIEKEKNRITSMHANNEIINTTFLKIKNNLPFHNRTLFEEDYFKAKDKNNFLHGFIKSNQEKCLEEIRKSTDLCPDNFKKYFEQKSKAFIDSYKYAECIKFSMDFRVLIANINILEKLLADFEPNASFCELKNAVFKSFSESNLHLSAEYSEHTHENITESMIHFTQIELFLKKRIFDELNPRNYASLQDDEVKEMEETKSSLEHDLKYHHYLDNIVLLKAALRSSVCEKRKIALLSIMTTESEKDEFISSYIETRSVQEKINLLNLQRNKILLKVIKNKQTIESKIDEIKSTIISKRRMHSTGNDTQIEANFNEDEKVVLLSLWSGYQGPETELKTSIKLKKSPQRIALLKSAFNLSQTPSMEEFKKLHNSTYIAFRIYCVSFYLSVLSFLVYFFSSLSPVIQQIEQERDILNEQNLFLETQKKEICVFSQSNFNPNLAKTSASVFSATQTCLERLESQQGHTLKDAPDMQYYFSNFHTLRALEAKQTQIESLRPLL